MIALLFTFRPLKLLVVVGFLLLLGVMLEVFSYSKTVDVSFVL